MVILQPALYYRGKRRVQFTLQILSVGGGEVVLNIIPRQIVVNHGIGVGDGPVVQKRRNNRIASTLFFSFLAMCFLAFLFQTLCKWDGHARERRGVHPCAEPVL